MSVSLPVGRLYDIDYRWRCLQRLWDTGSVFGGHVEDADVISELDHMIEELKVVIVELHAAKAGGWLE